MSKFLSMAEIESEHELDSDFELDYNNSKCNDFWNFDLMPKKSFPKSKVVNDVDDIDFPKIKAYDFTGPNLTRINNLKSKLFTTNSVSLKSPSPVNENELQFNSPTRDNEFLRKLHVGRTPFTEKFQNSPLCKPIKNFRSSDLFNTTSILEDIQDQSENNSRKLSILKEKDNILKYIEVNSEENQDNKQFNEIDIKLQIKLLFSHFFFLNERSIILKVLDKHDFRKRNSEGILNDQYISAYNCFHVSPTFCEMIKTDCYMDIKYYRVQHRFDSQWYCIKTSTHNDEDIRVLNKSSRSLHNEILTLSRLKHENIVRYYSSWIEYQSLYEQIEYNEHGSLEQILLHTVDDTIKTRFLTIRAAKELVLQIAAALDYIDTQWKYVHNDVAVYNILLFQSQSITNNNNININENSDNSWLVDSLFERKFKFEVLFKLCGFENCCLQENEHDCNKDVQDLATVAAESIGEEPINWKYTSPSKSITMKEYSDNSFALILMDTVLGHVERAQDLIELVTSY